MAAPPIWAIAARQLAGCCLILAVVTCAIRPLPLPPRVHQVEMSS